jgi:hypothetical protein
MKKIILMIRNDWMFNGIDPVVLLCKGKFFISDFGLLLVRAKPDFNPGHGALAASLVILLPFLFPFVSFFGFISMFGTICLSLFIIIIQ